MIYVAMIDDVFKKQYVSFALQINLIKPISNFVLKELNSFENYRELSYYLSKIIFYWKTSLKSTSFILIFCFSIFFFYFLQILQKAGKQTHYNIIKQYLKIKITARANMSTKMLEGISKTLLQFMWKKGPKKKKTDVLYIMKNKVSRSFQSCSENLLYKLKSFCTFFFSKDSRTYHYLFN